MIDIAIYQNIENETNRVFVPKAKRQEFEQEHVVIFKDETKAFTSEEYEKMRMNNLKGRLNIKTLSKKNSGTNE